MANRWVLHVDMDAFFSSVEQLTRPTLRGRPVLVAGDGARGVVAGASYEARAKGARSAMPTSQARKLIGFGAIVVPPRGAVYGLASRRVFAVLSQFATVVEKVSVDEAFLEPAALVGAGEAQVADYARELRERIESETGLAASVGAGSGKQYAKIASNLAKPAGVTVLDRASERERLAELPVRSLWGIGAVAEERLHTLGIATIGQLAAMDDREVTSVLGSAVGRSLVELARGHDDRPVVPRAQAKQISSETTLERDLTTIPAVVRVAEQCLDDSLRRLAKDGRGARTVSLKIRRADMSIFSRSATLPYATDDRETFRFLINRLARSLEANLAARLVGVGLSGLTAIRQEVLFPELIQQWDELREAPEDLGMTQEGGTEAAAGPAATESARPWRYGDDVCHAEFGHGWVMGCGHGIVTVRWETRTTTAPRSTSLLAGDAELTRANPIASLDWDEWLAAQADGEADGEAGAEGSGGSGGPPAS